jgi:hypothetical protein
MFSIGFGCMFILAFFETLNMKKIAMAQDVKNFMTLLMVLTGTLIAFSCYFIFEGKYTLDQNLLIFKDWRFYVAVSSEIIGIWLSRRNFEVNGNNITAINFALFFSLILVPILGYFGTSFFGFEDTLTVKYESKSEFFIFILIMTVLTILFFIDKLKGAINNIPLLLFLPVILSSSMFFTGKLMQAYDGFFAYGVIVSVLVIVFFVFTLRNGEFKRLKKEHIKLGTFIVLAWTIVVPLNAIAIKILALEFVTLLKRISQIISGVIVDRIYGNHNNLHKKDKYIISLMVIFGFFLYFFRG